MLKRLWQWWRQKSKKDQLLETMDQARLYEEWEAAAYLMDQCMEYDLWYVLRLVQSETNTSVHIN
jgi:TAG lipase/lysophosphatidylethanolamine acyltransferase